MTIKQKLPGFMSFYEQMATASVKALKAAKQNVTKPSGSIAVQNGDGTYTVIGKAAGTDSTETSRGTILVGDSTPPGVPTGITVKSVSGFLIVSWDGTLDGGVPSDFSHVTIVSQEGNNITVLGALTKAGSITSSLYSANSNVDVWAYSEDTNSNSDGTPAHNLSKNTDIVSVVITQAPIQSVVEQYYLSTSSVSPTGGSWSDTAPTWTSGNWIFTRSLITAGDGTQSTSPPICVTGNTGTEGIGISSVDVLYYLSSSSTDLKDGSWVTTYPGYKEDYWLWTKTVTTYTSGIESVSGASCITGSPGQDAVTAELATSNGDTLRNNAGSTDLIATVWHGSTEISDISGLQLEFGSSASLSWWEKGLSDSSFEEIKSSDSRLSENGFRLAVTASDVATSKTYRCSVNI